MLCRSFVLGYWFQVQPDKKTQALYGIYKEGINKESKTSGFCRLRVVEAGSDSLACLVAYKGL